MGGVKPALKEKTGGRFFGREHRDTAPYTGDRAEIGQKQGEKRVFKPKITKKWLKIAIKGIIHAIETDPCVGNTGLDSKQ